MLALGQGTNSIYFQFLSQRHKSYCYVFSKKALSCSLNICSRSYSRCLVEKAAISSLVWKYGNSFSYCESSAPSNSNWDKKFGWVFDKVAILGSNLKFPPSICKPQQQGPNPVQLTFNLENSKFLDLLPVQYLYLPDMIFVQNFTYPDFQAKSFTPQNCVICANFLAIFSIDYQ